MMQKCKEIFLSIFTFLTEKKFSQGSEECVNFHTLFFFLFDGFPYYRIFALTHLYIKQNTNKQTKFCFCQGFLSSILDFPKEMHSSPNQSIKSGKTLGFGYCRWKNSKFLTVVGETFIFT